MVYHGTGSGTTFYQDGIRVGTSTVKEGVMVVPSPVEMVVCSLVKELQRVIRGTPVSLWMKLRCTTGSSQRTKYAN